MQTMWHGETIRDGITKETEKGRKGEKQNSTDKLIFFNKVKGGVDCTQIF